MEKKLNYPRLETAPKELKFGPGNILRMRREDKEKGREKFPPFSSNGARFIPKIAVLGAPFLLCSVNARKLQISLQRN